MAEFRPAQPNIADYGQSFQRGMESGISAVQSKRDYALQQATMLMQQESHAWTKKDRVKREQDEERRKWIASNTIQNTGKISEPFLQSIVGDNQSWKWNPAILQNQMFTADNKTAKLRAFQDRFGLGYENEFETAWATAWSTEKDIINRKIVNGLDTSGLSKRNKDYYSKMVLTDPAFAKYSTSVSGMQSGIDLIGKFNYAAQDNWTQGTKNWWDDWFGPGTFGGDVLPYALPIAGIGGGFAANKLLARNRVAGAQNRLYGRRTPGGVKTFDPKIDAKGKVHSTQKTPALTNRVNSAQDTVNRLSKGLKPDGTPYTKTYQNSKKFKSAKDAAKAALDKATSNVNRYNKAVTSTASKISKARRLGGGGWAWTAPIALRGIGTAVAGEEGGAIGMGTGGAYMTLKSGKNVHDTLRMTRSARANMGMMKFIMAKIGKKLPAAMALSAVDGPLPIGELISFGIGVATIYSAIKEYNRLYKNK